MSLSTKARPRSRTIGAIILSLLLACASIILGASTASAEDINVFDPDTGITWTAQVGNLQFMTEPGCEIYPGSSNGQVRIKFRAVGAAVGHPVTVSGKTEGQSQSQGSFDFSAEAGAVGGFPLDSLTAGSYVGHVKWTDEGSVAREYVFNFTVTVCGVDPGANPDGQITAKCTVVYGTEYLEVTALFDNTKSTVGVDYKFDAYPHGEVYTVFNEIIDAGDTLKVPVSYPNDGEYEDGIKFVLYAASDRIYSATFKPSEECAAKQASPKASVIGSAKVTTSPAPRTLRLTNTDDTSNLSNDYNWVVKNTKGGVVKKGVVKGVGDNGHKDVRASFAAGTYYFSFATTDGKLKSNTVRFVVGKYAAPKVLKVVSKKKAKVQVSAPYPYQDIYSRRLNKSGKWSGWSKERNDVRASQPVIDMANAYNHRTTRYQLRFVPQRPADRATDISTSITR